METKKLYKINPIQGAQLIIPELQVAATLFERGKGLLGRDGLADDQGLWIKPGNNIHTFFMKFKIDCIFVDSQLIVRKIKSNINPFRVAGPYWKATSVIEVKAGMVDKWQLAEGDQLYVVS